MMWPRVVWILAVGLAGGVLEAQTTFGIIRGRVLDPTAAAVPGIEVVVTNLGTNISKRVTAASDGAYEAKPAICCRGLTPSQWKRPAFRSSSPTG